MSTEHKIKIVELAAFYEKTLTDEQIRVYSDFLAPRLTIPELTHAIGKYCSDPKNEFFPRPVSKLVAIIHEPVDDIEMAREVAARIVHAISKFGWCNEEPAKAFIGEVGWAVVRKQGGWANLCEASRHMNLETFQAQTRDLAKAQMALSRAGRIDQPPCLPGKDNVAVLNPPSNVDKQRQLSSMVKDLNEAIK